MFNYYFTEKRELHKFYTLYFNYAQNFSKDSHLIVDPLFRSKWSSKVSFNPQKPCGGIVLMLAEVRNKPSFNDLLYKKRFLKTPPGTKLKTSPSNFINCIFPSLSRPSLCSIMFSEATNRPTNGHLRGKYRVSIEY